MGKEEGEKVELVDDVGIKNFYLEQARVDDGKGAAGHRAQTIKQAFNPSFKHVVILYFVQKLQLFALRELSDSFYSHELP